MSAHSALYSKISSLAGGRVYPSVAPSGVALPRIVFSQIGSSHSHHLVGIGGKASYEFQIDCWGSSSQEATDLAESCRKLVDVNCNSNWGSETVHASSVSRLVDRYEPPQDGSGVGLFCVSLTVTIWITETL